MVETAADIVETSGTHGLSIQAVADRLKLTRTAAYYHFKSPGELLHAVAVEGFRRMRSELEASHAWGADPAQRLFDLGLSYVLYAAENPGFFRVMLGPASWAGFSDGDPRKAELDDAMQASLATLGSALQAFHDEFPELPAPVMVFALALVHGLSALWLDGVLDRLGLLQLFQPPRDHLSVAAEVLNARNVFAHLFDPTRTYLPSATVRDTKKPRSSSRGAHRRRRRVARTR